MPMIASCCRALLCALVLTGRAPQSSIFLPNVLPNPTLSGAGTAVTYWNVDTQSGDYRYRRAPGVGPDKSAAIEIESVDGSTGGLGRWYADAYLIQGGVYDLSVACRVTGAASGEAWFPEECRLGFPAGSAWTTKSARFTAQRTGSQRFYFQCYGAGSVLFAEPAVRLMKAAPPLQGEPVPAAGGAISRIVVGINPTPVSYSCALDLRRIFAAATGKQIEIAAAPDGKRDLYIGWGPPDLFGVFSEKVISDEGYFLYISPEVIMVAGRRPRGTYYGVQDLLRRIGYRDIWPGAYGECIPPGPLRLPARLSIGPAPAFAMRGGTFVQVEAKPGGTLHHVDTAEWIDWAARNGWNRWKASYCPTWDYGVERGGEWQEVSGHTVAETLLPAMDFKDHPEWFALVDGKRMRTHPIGTVAEPCISNPAFIDHVTNIILDYFCTHPDARRYSIGANDEPSYWCECPRCRAHDVGPVDWSKNGKATLPMTDRWLWFVNQVAARVSKEFPDRWIGTFAYASTAEPPRKVRPRRNVMIEFTAADRCRKHRFLDPKCPVNAGCVRRLKAWTRIAKAVSIYSYLDYRLVETPQACLSSDTNFYRSLYKLGVRYIADEVDTTPQASPALLDLRARLFWNLNTKLDEALAPFCREAYGPAAQDMRAFWLLQDRAVMRSSTPHPTENDLARFTPAVLAESQRLLDRSEKRGLSPDQRARVERARMSILFARYYVAQAEAEKGKRDAQTEAAKLREGVLAIARKYGFALNMGGWEAIGGK